MDANVLKLKNQAYFVECKEICNSSCFPPTQGAAHSDLKRHTTMLHCLFLLSLFVFFFFRVFVVNLVFVSVVISNEERLHSDCAAVLVHGLLVFIF